MSSKFNYFCPKTLKINSHSDFELKFLSFVDIYLRHDNLVDIFHHLNNSISSNETI